MKKIVFLFLALPILFACDGNDPVAIDETQDYTSYTITLPASVGFKTVLTGYYDEEGKCRILCNHGNWEHGGTTPEFILPEYHEIICLFFGSEEVGYYILRESLRLYKNTQNILIISGGFTAFPIEKRDEYNWPH